jgi:pilus assembly protein Flp/PilA
VKDFRGSADLNRDRVELFCGEVFSSRSSSLWHKPGRRFKERRLYLLEKLSMWSASRCFVLDESGLELVEWAIVGGILVAVGALIFVAIGQDVTRSLGSLKGVVSGIP